MKICGKCKLNKKRIDFHKDTTRSDGLSNSCKVCKSVRNKEYCFENKEKILFGMREYQREYQRKYKLKHGESYANKWNKENKDKVNHCARERYKNRDKDVFNKKNNCRMKTFKLLAERGISREQGCVVCGKKAVIHHNDYDNPFDIDWYCRVCHVGFHQLEKLGVENFCLQYH